MTIKIVKTKIPYIDQELNTLLFIPAVDSNPVKAFAVFTHGYTSHKSSILSWGTRLAEEGIATAIFDQPGHYLGTYSEVESFETYKAEAPKLFFTALKELETSFNEVFPLSSGVVEEEGFKLILGGHSLGALLSLIALETSEYKETEIMSLCVGLGMPPSGVTHIFDTPFYKSTLNVRRQLVSPAISPDIIFPWIKERKSQLNINKKRIHFITGADDVVVGKDGTQLMVDYLQADNEVSYEKPTKLAHHMPELAAPHIKKFLRDEGII